MALLGLPTELLYEVISLLLPPDLCRLRETCKGLRDICDQESVWKALCKNYFEQSIPETGDNFTFKDFYQKILHPYGSSIGIWQQTNLYPSGGLLKISPGDDGRFLKLTYLWRFCDINGDKSFLLLDLLSITLDENKNIYLNDRLDANPLAMRRKLRDTEPEFELISPDIHLNKDLGELTVKTDILKFSMEDTGLYIFKRVPSERHRRRCRVCPQLSSISGLFQAYYGDHGPEVVYLQDGQGVKVTGDRNVPCDEISFRVTQGDPVLIPLEEQATTEGVIRATTEDYLQYLVTEVPGHNSGYDFIIPDGMEVDGPPIPWRTCLGRWVAEAQIAEWGFKNPSFIPANVVVFSEDEFAVMFLDLNCISLYRRLNI